MNIEQEISKLFEDGQYELVIKKCKELIPSEKLNMLYLIMGMSESNLQNHLGAIESFTEYIKLECTDVSGYLQRGISKMDLQQYESAIDDFTKVIELNSFYSGGYYWRGLSKFEIKDFEGDIIHEIKVINLKDRNNDGYRFDFSTLNFPSNKRIRTEEEFRNDPG